MLRAARALGAQGGADARQAAAGRAGHRRRLGRRGGGAAAARRRRTRRDRAPALGADVPACLLAGPRAARAGATCSSRSRSTASPARRCCWSIPASRSSTAAVFARLGRRRPRPARRLGRGPQRPRGAGAGAWCRRSATVLDALCPAPASPACRARARPASGCSIARPIADAAAAADRGRASRLVAVPNQSPLTRRSRSGTGA